MAVKMPRTYEVSFGITFPTNAKDSDISIALPIPCKTRAAISMLIEDDNPQTNDAVVKIKTPLKYSHFPQTYLQCVQSPQ